MNIRKVTASALVGGVATEGCEGCALFCVLPSLPSADNSTCFGRDCLSTHPSTERGLGDVVDVCFHVWASYCATPAYCRARSATLRSSTTPFMACALRRARARKLALKVFTVIATSGCAVLNL